MHALKRVFTDFPAKPAFRRILFSVVTLYLFPKKVFTTPELLSNSFPDHGWMVGLNLALREGLIWGRDIVFTYGPLGFLYTGFPDHASKAAIVLYHVFVVVNGVYIVWHLVERSESVVKLLLVTVLLFFSGSVLFEKSSITLMLFFAFHSLRFCGHGRLLSLAAMSCCSLLALFIKVNTGIVLNLLVPLVFLFGYWKRPVRPAVITAFLFLHFGILWAGSVLLRVDLPGYVRNSLLIIDGYNDAMYLPVNRQHLTYALAMCALFAMPYVRFLNRLLPSLSEVFMALQSSLLAYILFKQGFVRSAPVNFHIFMTAFPLLAMFACRFTSIAGLKTGLRLSMLLICLVSIFATRDTLAEEVNRNIGFVLFKEEKTSINPGDRPGAKSVIPPDFTSRMGGGGVDVLGYGISYVFYNGLRYDPRPVFQSYSAYHPGLIDLNVAKYDGAGAPDHVLYHFKSIDDRHTFWDEPMIYLPLMANYSVVDSAQVPAPHERLLLFKRRGRKRPLTSRVVLDTVVGLNSRVPIPRTEGLLYMKLECDRTMAGALRRLFYQPSDVRIELSYPNGVRGTYRAILPVLRSGVPINRKVTNRNEAFRFFLTDGLGCEAVDSFEVKGDPLFLRKDLRVRFVEYSLGG